MTDDDVVEAFEAEALRPEKEAAAHRSNMLAKKCAKRWLKFVKTRKQKRAMAVRMAARQAATQAKKNEEILLKAAKSRGKTTAKRRKALQQKVAAKAPAGRPQKRAKLQMPTTGAIDGAMRALVV